MTTALITSIAGLRNRGVEALVLATIIQLRERHPELKINILTTTPDYDAIRLQPYNINLANEHLLHGYYGQLRRLLIKSFPFYKPPPSPGYKNIKKIIDSSSVVIASGGDVFSSEYGTLNRHLMPLKIAIESGIPVVFLAQSIGPFKTDKESEAWLSVARYSNLITIREKLSYNYVTKDLGLSKDLVKLTADPGFLLPPSQNPNLLNFYGLNQGQPVIALATSRGITHFTAGDYDRHLRAWHKLSSFILEQFNARILLIPHVQDIYPKNDDRILTTDILRMLNYDPRVRIVSADHTASELKGLICACDMVIAERMHAAIAGLSSSICTIAVGYSVKAEGIMSDLLGGEEVRNMLLISIDQFLDDRIAWPKICAAWDQRHQVSDKLNDVLPQTMKLAESNYDMISRLLVK